MKINWKAIPEGLKVFGHILERNKSTILVGAGLLGWVGTAVLVGQAAPKAQTAINKAKRDKETAINVVNEKGHEVIDNWDDIKSTDLTTTEIVKATWKYYIPAGVAVSATIISDICFYRIGMRELAALTASVTYLTSNRDKLEKKLKEVVGEEKYNEIKKEIKKELVEEKVKEVKKTDKTNGTATHKRFPAEETGYGDQLFLDGWSGRFFRSSIEEVIKGINSFNDTYNTELPWPKSSGEKITCCPTAWNDFYNFMHIVPTHQGEEFGYPANVDYIKPGSKLIDPNKDITLLHEDELLTNYRDIGEDIYVIEPSIYPMLCWKEL